jgi:CubicO group peptidase (beta-lactamase class C family)
MSVPIHGHCDATFIKVKQAFINNFAEEGELGAAIAIYIDGDKVVDLWGGYADNTRSQPWKADTMAGFYSAGKPLAALCVLKLVDDGIIELDKPVCGWWPEFAAGGKEQITVRQLLSHQAGLQSIRKRLPEEAMLDWDLMTRELAAAAPWNPTGSIHTYHTNTYGFLAGELVRRTSGLDFSRYFAENIAQPLKSEVYFGVPDGELPRAAELVWRSGGDPPAGILDQELTETQRMVLHTYFNPSGLSSMGLMNTQKWRQAVIPSTNGHGTADGIARIYHILAHGGSYGDTAIISQDLLTEATRVQSKGFCPVLERDVSFCLGFQRTRPERPLGPNPDSFGHYGTGGSLGFADPKLKMGFGYVMNDIIPRWQSPRNRALLEALYECV